MVTEKTKTLELSPTTGLSLFKECPRCFWLHYHEGIKRPETIFPSLPGGIDRVMKKYYDSYRAKSKLPPELEGQVEGRLLPNQELMDRFRDWRRAPRYEDKKINAVLRGGLDDCLLDGDYYIPLDVKTRGAPPKEGQSEKFYQTQLDSYALMLGKNGYKTKDHAYLVYYFPESVDDKHLVRFETQVVKLEINPDRAREIFTAAVNCYNGPIPESHTECGFCAWYSDLLEFD